MRYAINARPRLKYAVAVLGDCLAEARPCVQIIFFLRFMSGAEIAMRQPGAASFSRVLAGAVTWQLAIVAVYLFNGVMDVAEDRLNGSGRPIARGSLDTGTAMRITAGTAALALAGGVLIGNPFNWTDPAILALGYLYSGPPFCLKGRVFGVGLIGSLGGLLTYYSGYTGSGGSLTHATLPIFAITMSMWMGLVGGLTKDFSDRIGDAAAGRQTAVVRFHDDWVRLAVAIMALALAGVFLGVAVSSTTALLTPAMVTLVGAATVAALSLSTRSAAGRSTLRGPYKAFMVTQYTAHILLICSTAA
jgi:4-hydroxybenzoate polyprenyltransferase